jgi:nitrate/TMAO reductase-like tetraheme cytochrome c subunit
MPSSPQVRGRVTHGLLGLLAAGALLSSAQAEERRPARPVVTLPAYQQECASCHQAYPPGMLPAESWQRVMGQLKTHYGVDASLDTATVKALTPWLVANAGTWKRVSEAPPQDRITRSAWFERKHREVTASVFKRPAIGSPSNCKACHTASDQGDFNEHNVRIPR